MKAHLISAYGSVALMCIMLGAPAPASAGPLTSLGNKLKSVGNAINPFNRSEPKPAAEVQPMPKAKPTAAVAKPAKTVKTVPVKKKKAAAPAPKKSSPDRTAGPDEKIPAGSRKTEDKPGPAAGSGAATAGAIPPPALDSAAPAVSPEPPKNTPPAEIPFGAPVMGRKGYVRSPFAEEQGMVDVTDIPAGAKVKCPFTGKIFRVP